MRGPEPYLQATQHKKFPSEASWTEYVWERPQLPSLKNYMDNHDGSSRGSLPSRGATASYSHASMSRIIQRAVTTRDRSVVVHHLPQATDTSPAPNDPTAYRQSTQTPSSWSGSSGSRPSSRHHSATTFRDNTSYQGAIQGSRRRSQSEYEQAVRGGSAYPSHRSSYAGGPPMDQSPFEARRRAVPYSMDPSSDPRYPPYAPSSPSSASHPFQQITHQPRNDASQVSSVGANDTGGSRKRRGNLPKESTAILNDWFCEHAAFPYPKEDEKQQLQAMTGLSISQVSAEKAHLFTSADLASQGQKTQSRFCPTQESGCKPYDWISAAFLNFRANHGIPSCGIDVTRSRADTQGSFPPWFFQISNWFINARRRRRPDPTAYRGMQQGPPVNPSAGWR